MTADAACYLAFFAACEGALAAPITAFCNPPPPPPNRQPNSADLADLFADLLGFLRRFEGGG